MSTDCCPSWDIRDGKSRMLNEIKPKETRSLTHPTLLMSQHITNHSLCMTDLSDTSTAQQPKRCFVEHSWCRSVLAVDRRYCQAINQRWGYIRHCSPGTWSYLTRAKASHETQRKPTPSHVLVSTHCTFESSHLNLTKENDMFSSACLISLSFRELPSHFSQV